MSSPEALRGIRLLAPQVIAFFRNLHEQLGVAGMRSQDIQGIEEVKKLAAAGHGNAGVWG